MKNTLETRLGLFFAFALVAAVLILELIGAADFLRGGYRVNATFDSVQELKKGDLVKMAGVEIGRVESIGLVGNRAKIIMKIHDQFVVKTDSIATIQFAGLLGQNFVAIEGGSEAAPKVLPDAPLQTKEQPNLSTIMVKLDNVASGVEGLTKSFSAENFSTLLGPVTDFVKQNTEPLTATIANIRSVSDNIAQGKGTVGKLLSTEEFYNAAYTTVTNLQEASADLKGFFAKAEGMITNATGIIDNINSGQGTLGKLTKDETLYNETATAMTNLREILQKINQGDGTIGKLVNEQDFYRNAKLTLQKVEKATEGLEDQGPLSVLGIAVNSLF
jgi:phospholipid/cholesterol/gamma-HCH transport system substrate-binding protein